MQTARAPQQARSIKTRASLAEAGASCLVKHGYAGTSTQVVAQAAGVSQGALFKHFPTKAQLLEASLSLVLDRWFDEFHEGLAGRLGGREVPLERRVRLSIETLWGIFRSDEMRAVFEVYAAARTDAPLEALLSPLLAAHHDRIVREARALLVEVGDEPAFEGAIDAVVFAMQGASLGLFRPDAQAEERLLNLFERLAMRELEAFYNPSSRGTSDVEARPLRDPGVHRPDHRRGPVGPKRPSSGA